MDAERFDALARTLGATVSRRRALRLLAAGALGAAVGTLGLSEAGATHFFGCRHVGKPCTGRAQCCSGICKGPAGRKTCRAHHTGTCQADQNVCLTGTGPAHCNDSGCLCFRTTGGARFCGSGGDSFICSNCTRDGQCTDVTGPGSACVVMGPVCNGCDSEGRACARPCLCKANGSPCNIGSQCCSGTCAGFECCKPLGSACTPETADQCCTGLCLIGKCTNLFP